MRTLELGPLAVAAVAWSACGPLVPIEGDTEAAGSSTTMGAPVGTSSGQGDEVSDGAIKHDEPWVEMDVGASACEPGGTCNLVDLVLVIDNSGTMGEEQLNLARNFPQLVDELMGLVDVHGNPVDPDVNIMVTTTDFGHPLCTAFQKPDYEPRQGAPVYTGCNSRIQRFTGLDPVDPVVIEEACTEGCPSDVAPGEHFINFGPRGSNVPNDDVHAALSCIGPQGIDGCGFEAPLETMLRAIDENACWNRPDQPQCDESTEWAAAQRGFLRDDATLVIAIISDELDCSVQAPGGYSYFTDVDNAAYWELDPATGTLRPSSAICFNAGVTCEDGDGDGIYESCTASTNDVLHPVERYTAYLDYLVESRGKDVVMLGIFGVPEVVAHDPEPPYEPTAGGVADLVYRQWQDFPYPAGDILPEEWDAGVRAADKTFEFGALGPGCTGTDGLGNFTGQGLPPVRMRQVCESLDSVDAATGEPQVRCCIESICDTDFSPAIRCLTGLLSATIGGE